MVSKPSIAAVFDPLSADAVNMLAAYLFNEGEGTTVTDYTGNGHDITLNLTALAWEESEGYLGSPALKSSATAGATRGTLPGFTGFQPEWSIEIGLTYAVGDTYATLLTSAGGAFDAGIFISSNKINLYRAGDNLGTNALTVGQSYRLFITCDGTLTYYYIDGVFDSSHTIVNVGNLFKPESICNNTGSETFVGKMDLLFIWDDRYFNAGEVASRHAAPFGMFEAESPLLGSLVSFYKLDEVSGVGIDAQNGNTLTDNNGVGTSGDGGREFIAADEQSLSHVSNESLQTGDIDYTVSVDVLFNSIDTIQTLVSKYGDDGNNEWAVIFEPAGEQDARIGYTIVDAAQNETTIYSTVEIEAFERYCVSVEHDAAGNTISITINGVTDSVAYTDGSSATDGVFRIGALGDTPSLFLDGVVYSAGFWKRTLTSEEAAMVCSEDYPFAEAADTGFDGILPVGFFALFLTWSGADTPIPPISGGGSKLPWTRRRRMHR